MRFLSTFGPRPFHLLGTVFVLTLLLAVACGAAATATPAAKPPAAAAAPKAPVAAAPAPPAAPAVPAAPKATPVPAPPAAKASAVHPGKVTWMVGSLGNERFDYALTLAGGHDYARQVHAFLISSDVKDGGRVEVPGIATNWGVSSDGLTWTLTIRKGVKFHDGKELTAEDVLWTLRHTMGPQVKEYATSTLSLAWGAAVTDRIEQTGPDRVSMITKVPATDFLTTISEVAGNWNGVVYPKRATLHNVEEEAAYDKKPIGAGIVKLVKHVPADSMTFERFADYYYQPKNGLPTDKRVNFNLLDMRMVPEEATRVAALRAGEADIAPVSLGGRKQVEAGGGRVMFAPEGAYFWVRGLGCWKPQFPCSDKRVRQALNYAIDKKAFQNQLYSPEVFEVKGWGVVTPSTIGYSPELQPFPFDPVKARQLLADAGYPGGKGFGKLVINTYASIALPLMPEAAQLAADFWKKELGLEVEVKVGDEAAIKKAEKLTADLHGQIIWRDNETRLDAATNLRVIFGPPQKLSSAHNNPELFALTEKALAIFDPAEREKALNSLFRRLRDEAYDIPLGYFNTPWGVGPRIRTWEPYPLAFYPSSLHTITLK